MLATADVTGVVLAGGRGSRMGGVDKGLVAWHGRPLAAHAIERLRPQVGPLLVVANRNAAAYAGWGVRVAGDEAAKPAACPDGASPTPLEAYAGPLAGMLAALDSLDTPWAAFVPCDAPRLPADLVARLAAATDDACSMAVAARRDASGELRLEPLFCLVRREARDRLRSHLAGGGRAAHGWVASEPHAVVSFDDEGAFVNLNREADLVAALDAG